MFKTVNGDVSMNRYPILRIASIALIDLLLISSCRVSAACDKDPECGDSSAWAVFTHIVLKQSSPETPDYTELHASFDHQANDASIDIVSRESDKSTSGTIALVGGQVMLSKGLKLDRGYEIDALDAPVLSIKLLMIMLGRVFPNGPEGVAGVRHIDRTDNDGIKFATSSATGYIPAPWHVQGKVSKLADGSVAFDLALSRPANGRNGDKETYTMNMAGELSMLGHPVFFDSDSLDGWTTYGIGPQVIKQETGTIYDYGAKPHAGSVYKTIGDIRAFIATEEHPGHRDETMDFTGFWKEKCDQAFGLQIMHQGGEGKYSIVFCGPGGCGDPSESRLTFITGDNQYQVVSEDELVFIRTSGDRDTYHRCTKETHPILKYND
jgi:hypothetical protein